jgi:hypothetical protein
VRVSRLRVGTLEGVFPADRLAVVVEQWRAGRKFRKFRQVEIDLASPELPGLLRRVLWAMSPMSACSAWRVTRSIRRMISVLPCSL